MPTNNVLSFIYLPPLTVFPLTLAQPCLIRALLAHSTVRAPSRQDVTTLLSDGLQDLGRIGLSRPNLRYKDERVARAPPVRGELVEPPIEIVS